MANFFKSLKLSGKLGLDFLKGGEFWKGSKLGLGKKGSEFMNRAKNVALATSAALMAAKVAPFLAAKSDTAGIGGVMSKSDTGSILGSMGKGAVQGLPSFIQGMEEPYGAYNQGGRYSSYYQKRLRQKAQMRAIEDAMRRQL